MERVEKKKEVEAKEEQERTRRILSKVWGLVFVCPSPGSQML